MTPLTGQMAKAGHFLQPTAMAMGHSVISVLLHGRVVEVRLRESPASTGAAKDRAKVMNVPRPGLTLTGPLPAGTRVVIAGVSVTFAMLYTLCLALFTNVYPLF